MPIYEYACAACGHEFEEWQKMSDAPVRTCPKCKKKKVERLISRTAFQLKGGGWYADLYSSSKPGEGKGKDDKSEAKAEAKSEGKADSKADAKTSSSEGASASSKDSSGGAAKGGAKKESKKKETAAKKAESRAA